MTHKAIVFDLDGTLIDSIPDVCTAVNKTLDLYGRTPVSNAALRQMVGHGARVMLEKAFGEEIPVPPPAIIDEAVQHYLDFYKARPAYKTIIYPGVVKILENYASDGVPMGICTNKPAMMTDIVLNVLGLSKFFCGIAAGDNVPYPKPDSRHIKLTLERMGTTTVPAIMVGDSKTDFVAAHNAGVPSVAVSYGYADSNEDLSKATATISSFEQLPATIVKIMESRK